MLLLLLFLLLLILSLLHAVLLSVLFLRCRLILLHCCSVAFGADVAVSIVTPGVIAVAGRCCFFSFLYVFLFLSVSFLYLSLPFCLFFISRKRAM
jgi:hypothetical protein